MRGPGFAGRLAVFAATAAVCAVALLALRPGGALSLAAPTRKELEELKSAMTTGARLHRLRDVADPRGTSAFCRECHPPAPHPGRDVGRAMLNEHTQWMDCLLCHWEAGQDGGRPEPSWQVQPGFGAFLAVLPPARAARAALVRLRAAATVRRACFPEGPPCGACHRPGGIGHLLRPGTSPSRAATLERLEDYFTLAPGRKWYFPSFR